MTLSLGLYQVPEIQRNKYILTFFGVQGWDSKKKKKTKKRKIRKFETLSVSRSLFK